MELICYDFSEFSSSIQIAERRRDWMDKTAHNFAYRCLPLSIANAYGWTIHNKAPFEAIWDGGNESSAIEIRAKNPNISVQARSILGYGILSFEVPAIFKTSQGYDLWLGAVSNLFKDAIQPLSALIDSELAHHSFAIHWQFTRPNTLVEFQADEAIAQFFPVEKEALKPESVEFCDLEDDKDLERRWSAATNTRQFLWYLKGKYESKFNNKFEGWYMRGEIPFREGQFPEHQRHIDMQAFQETD